jgi:hypothetical protein
MSYLTREATFAADIGQDGTPATKVVNVHRRRRCHHDAAIL